MLDFYPSMHEALLKQRQVTQAADSRFFYSNDTERPRDDTLGVEAFGFTQGFWLAHSDLLAHDANIVFQAGENAGEFGNGSRPATEDCAIALSLDVSNRKSAEFRWQVVRVDAATRERRSSQLQIAKSAVRASEQKYNQQGKVIGTAEGDPKMLLAVVKGIIGSSQFNDHVAALRERRENAEAKLAQFAVESLGKYTAARYESLLSVYERAIEKAGFPMTQPIKLFT